MFHEAIEGIVDAAGLAHWASQMDEGMSLAAVADLFVNSAEGQQRFGGLSQGELIDQAYQNVFNRDADEGGAAHWFGQLEDGLPTSSFILELSESAEFILQTGTV